MANMRAWRGDPLDQRLALRALLVALTGWIKTGEAPPPSTYPTLRAGTLVRADARRNPTIPGLTFPTAPYTPHRLSFGEDGETKGIVVREPPVVGAPYVTLVPKADSLGNELGGIQSVELRVPLASYLPWQLRTLPPTDRLVSFQGTFVPLQRVEADRRRSGDSRPSLERLYPSREAFLTAVDRATATLVSQRFLLPEDVRAARDRMERTWDWVNTH
jgi:hypothetical protein